MVILYWLVGLLIVAGLAKLLGKSLKFILKLLLNSLGGLMILSIFNFFGGFLGLYIDLSFINALIAGVLGMPGVILLLLIQLL